MLPIIIQWPSTDIDSLARLQTVTEDVAMIFNGQTNVNVTPYTGQAFLDDPLGTVNIGLIFNNATGISNLNLSTFQPTIDLPPGNVRNISITIENGGAGFFNFGIVGSDGYGNQISEVLVVPGTSTNQSVNFYRTLLSVTIQTAPVDGMTVSVGIGPSGYTTLPMLDVYNKTCSYTISYSNIEGSDEIELSPFFVTEPLITWVDRKQVRTTFTAANEFPFNADNANVIINSNQGSPPYELPFSPAENETVAISISGIPLTSIGTNVIGEGQSDISFTQTIIQQGGRF